MLDWRLSDFRLTSLAALVYNTLQEALPNANESKIRSLLGAFLFHDDDIYKPINVLSGGEKARVSLAKTLDLLSFLLQVII